MQPCKMLFAVFQLLVNSHGGKTIVSERFMDTEHIKTVDIVCGSYGKSKRCSLSWEVRFFIDMDGYSVTDIVDTIFSQPKF